MTLTKSCFVLFSLIILHVNKLTANAIQNTSNRKSHEQFYFIPSKVSSRSVNLSLSNNTFIKGNKLKTSLSPKRWHVSRASRKQYEVITMLWRKTNIFVDVESKTAVYEHKRENLMRKAVNRLQHQNQFQVSLPRPIVYSSTPSYFEFYYLHEVDDRIKRKDSANPYADKHTKAKGELQKDIDDTFAFVPKSPTFAFRVFDQYYKRPQVTPHPFVSRIDINQTKNENSFSSVNLKTRLKSTASIFRYRDTKTRATTISYFNKSRKNTHNRVSNNINAENFIGNETRACTADSFSISNYTNNIKSTSFMKKDMYYIKATTFYDKIKFFETYDKNTRIPKSEDSKLFHIENASEIIAQQILLEHVEQDFGQNSHTEKHNIERRNKLNEKCVDKRFYRDLNVTLNNNDKMNTTKKSENRLKIAPAGPKMLLNDLNKTVPWLKYPFAAVYIYEPSQVHCDAGAISPHWLIAAGSCLSRHHNNPGGEGQSAFVAYCGDSWWRPERVAYVKYSLVHPRYHPRDKTRRYLYNIGVIQVVSSMASACIGWSPMTLMSHQFAADQDSSKAVAIGWGLDRLDNKYASTELPRWPLTAYEALVYSDSCPGNIEYSKPKHFDENIGAANVYCLLLPPYAGEKGDPVHGSLLLIGEKLIGLYLQEERRLWGEQSAQYTGTWRLIPWVLDVAREPDEADTFTVDI